MNSPAVRRLKDGYTGMFIRATYTETHHVGKEASIWAVGQRQDPNLSRADLAHRASSARRG